MGQAGPSWSQMVAWKHRRTSGLLPVGTSLSSSDSGWSFPDGFSFLGFPDVDADAHPLSDSIMSAR